MRRLIEATIVLAVLSAGILAQEKTGDKPGPALRPVEEFRIVPVRVHLLRCTDPAAAGTKLTETDITRIFRKANGIWHAAGVHLWVESIVEENPASIEGHENDRTLPMDALLPLRRDSSMGEGMFHVYYVGAIVLTGDFMRRDGIFVQEAARLVVVPGGIDEPLPRVTSHELGRGMGLPHRQARTNLMASGTTGTSLNEDEIQTARTKAESFKWTETAEAFLKSAEAMSSEKKSQAESRFRAIADLPGVSPLKDRAKERLEKLRVISDQ